MPDATGLELLAPGAGRARRWRRCYFRDTRDAGGRPGRDPRPCSATLRGQGIRASWPACTASTTTPRSRAWASSTSCSTWPRRPPDGQAARRTASAPTCDSVTRRVAHRRSPGARGLRHVRRRLRGHPDLRRILMPEDYEGHPQRRDFPVGGEPVDLHPQRGANGWRRASELAEQPTVVRVPPARAERHALAAGAARAPRQGGPDTTQELLTLNFGPHHPATHGVLRLLVTLQGEVVRDIKPIIGYVHTGIEKTAEDKAYWKVIPIIERMDYLAYYFNAMAYCGAVETLLEVEVPTRGAVPARDPPRAEPHRLAPGLAGHERARPRRDLDVPVLLPRARADPRPVRDVLRAAHAHALLPGRRRHRGHPARLRAQAARVLEGDARRAPTSTGRSSTRNEIVLAAPARHLPARRRDAARRSA